MKSIIFTFFFLVVSILPETASAQGIFGGVCNGINCSACDIAVIANSFISWLIGAVMVLFAVLMVIAGFGLVTSQGNPDALNTAKSKFTNAIIGLIIVLSAWILVDTLMRGLLVNSDNADVSGYLAWSEIQCMTQSVSYVASSTVAINVIDAYADSDAANSISSGGAFALQYSTFDSANDCRLQTSRSFSTLTNCIQAEASVPANSFVTSACDTSTYGTPPNWVVRPLCAAAVPDSVVADPTADGQFSYQSGIQAQRQHASPALEALLSCMEQIVPGNVGEISSISDGRIVSGQYSFAYCRSRGNSGASEGRCAHTINSRHYGGDGSRGDRSWAVDFGDQWNNTILCAAANQCGNIADCGIHGGNHTHISISY